MAEAQAQGSDGNGGCTDWETAWKTVQLGEDRHQGEGGGLHGCEKERRQRRRRPRLKRRCERRVKARNLPKVADADGFAPESK